MSIRSNGALLVIELVIHCCSQLPLVVTTLDLLASAAAATTVSSYSSVFFAVDSMKTSLGRRMRR